MKLEVNFMSSIAMEAARLMDALPESDRELVYELIKKLVLAWDPDYTKATPEERKSIDEAEKSGYVNLKDINWDNIENDE